MSSVRCQVSRNRNGLHLVTCHVSCVTFLLAGFHPVSLCIAVQDHGLFVAGGHSAAGLVAARSTSVAGGRFANPALLRPGPRPVCPDRVAGEKSCGGPGVGLCPDLPATLPDCGPGFLVLPWQTALAGGSLFCLPALAAPARDMVAMVISGDGAGHLTGTLAGPEADRARTPNRAVIFCGDVVSGAGIYECVFHALLVCV